MPDARFTFYWKTRDAWEAMLGEIGRARATIDFEQFLFVNDVIGRRFADALAARARAGVTVRILLDAAGSFGAFFSGLPETLLREPNVEARFFNPLSPWRVGNALSWYFRDHRRILVVDGRVGFTGGACIEDAMADWRETQVRVEDPVVGEMEEAFARMWRATKEHKGLRSFPKPRARGSAMSFLINSPRYHQRFVYHALRHAVRAASASVSITSPYFVPDPRLFRALRRAARRGVDVRILLSGPSDHPIVDIASNSYYERAFRAGIRIFHYGADSARSPLHAKTAVVDGRWAMVGTANMDNLSLLFNYECAVVTEGGAFVAAIEERFKEDVTRARELARAEWRRRSRTEKFLEKLIWPLHRFL